MFRTIQDFLDSWAYETESTVKIYRELTDASLEEKVHSDVRTLGRLAWHIVQTLPEMGGLTGLKIQGPAEDDPIPSTASELTKRLQETSDSLADAVKNQWSDQDLMVEDEMYGENWPRGKTLTSLVHHQIHHRGQMTVLMRQVGLKVPGVYGPSREEWADYGMPAQE